MSNEEILKKAIKKAEKKGFKLVQFLPGKPTPMDYAFSCRIIFSHDFAKAFWGEKEIMITIDDYDTNAKGPQLFMGGTIFYPYDEGAAIEYKCVAFLYHLQVMATYQNPLEYLENFLD